MAKKILCIDTSSSNALLCLGEDGLVVESAIVPSADHATKLLGSLEQLLAKHRVALKDMDAFAIVTGPGSFTGLRIGLSTVKGFAYALRKPIVSVHALSALALGAVTGDAPRVVYPVIHSRKGKVFTAGYRKQGERVTQIQEPIEVEPGPFFQDKSDALLLGSGLEKQPELFAGLRCEKSEHHHLLSPVVCSIAFEKFNAGDFVDAFAVEPDYVVSKVASML